MVTRAAADGHVTIPPLPPRHVPRARLLGALDSAIARPLTLLAAGPGSGKTVLLSDWAGRRDPPPVWLPLDLRDNEVGHFVSTLNRGVTAAGVAAPGQHVYLSDGVDDVFGALLADRRLELPLVIVLDDAHVLTDPALLRAVDGWLRRWSDEIRLVIAARSDPLLPLHRYRLAGAMSELRAADLAMTHDEAKLLLAAHGVRLSQRQLAVLEARTEGWTAGLRLSAMRMEGTTRASRFVRDFAMDAGSAGEYLLAEVLDQQPPDVRRLLMETSFLHEVDGDIAQAVTGRAGAGEILVELSRSNSFVLRVERTGAVFRYHQLFAEVLRYLLRREPAEYRRELVRRAARWCLANGDAVNAVHYAGLAEDTRFAARILARGGLVGLAVNRRAFEPGSRKGFAAAAGGDDDPDLADTVVAAAAMAAWDGRFAQAAEQLDRLRGLPELDADVAMSADLVALMVARGRHAVRDADETTRRLLEAAERGGRRELAAVAQLERAMTHFYAGSHVSVESGLRAAAADAAAAELAVLELDCVTQLAHVNAFWGRFRTSSADEQRANRLLRENPALTAPPALPLAVAIRALLKADFAAAKRAVGRAANLPAQPRDHDVRAEIAMLQGWLDRSGDDRARDHIEAVVRAGASIMRDYAVAALADIAVRAGRPEEALRALDAAPKGPPSGVACLARSSAHLALGRPTQAEADLRPVLTASGVPATRTVLVAALVLQAKIRVAQGVVDGRSVESLVRAVELANGEILLPFVGGAEPLAEVLARHPSLAEQWPLAPHGAVDGAVGRSVPSTADPLTDKEGEVLRWLATSLSTREIADELGLSVNTVKTHLAAIYRKLAAARRRDAVLRARALGLL